MKLLITALIIASTCISSYAQDYKFRDNEFPGEVTLKNGQVVKGFLRVKGSDKAPWRNQKEVSFFTEAAIADGKLKGKEMEKYKPKDIAGYSYEGKTFESMKISAAKIEIGIGMTSTQFVEVLVSGKLSLYKLYDYPSDTPVVTEEQRIAREEELEGLRNNPLMVVLKEGGEFTTIYKTDLTELLGDCSELKEKYVTGGYGKTPIDYSEKKKIGQMVAKERNKEMFEPLLEEIFGDYNSTCK